jgi:hypothetical protein
VPALRTGTAGKRRHGDYAIALALAHYASRQGWAEYGYVSASRAAPAEPGVMRMEPDPHEDAPGRAWWDGPVGAGLRGGVW